VVYGAHGGRGHRWIYRLTGLPGWMRFGYSPGWVGTNATDVGPRTTIGQWPTPQPHVYWQAMRAGQAPYPWAWADPFYEGIAPSPGEATGMPVSQMAPEQELEFLRNQAEMMAEQLELIHKRLQELEEE